MAFSVKKQHSLALFSKTFILKTKRAGPHHGRSALFYLSLKLFQIIL